VITDEEISDKQSKYVEFIIIGKMSSKSKRFTKRHTDYRYTQAIKLYRGNIWGVLANGKRELIKSVK